MKFPAAPTASGQAADLIPPGVSTDSPLDQTREGISPPARMDSPTSLTAAAYREPYRVVLAWQVPGPNSLVLSVDEHSDIAVVYRSQGGAFIEIGRVTAGDRSFQDTSVSLGSYSYRVTFKKGDIESSPSNTIGITVSAALVRPILNAASSQPAVVTLGIVNGNTIPSEVLVERSEDGVNFSQLSGSYSHGLTDTNAVGGKKYWYRARAISIVSGADEVRESSHYSDPVTVMAMGVPSVITAPSNLTARQGAGLSVTLSWSDNSSNETGFIVSILNSLGDPMGLTGARVGANTTTATVGVLSTGTYIFRIRAVHEAGPMSVESSYAPDATATVRSSTILPTTLSASNVASRRVQLSWSSISSNGIGELISIQIHRSDRGDVYQNMIGVVAPSVQTFTDQSGLGGNWNYYYKIIGVFRVPRYLDSTGTWRDEVLAESNAVVVRTEI